MKDLGEVTRVIVVIEGKERELIGGIVATAPISLHFDGINELGHTTRFELTGAAFRTVEPEDLTKHLSIGED